MRTPGDKCSVLSCWRRVHGRGWCAMHYYRWRRNGDPLRKLRARGVMDAPVLSKESRERVVKIGPSQLSLAKVLTDGPKTRLELARILQITIGTLEVLVSRFRKKFGYAAIRTIRNYGYAMGVVT